MSASVGAFAYGAVRLANAALPEEARVVRAIFGVTVGASACVTILVFLAAYRILSPVTVLAGAALFAASAHLWARGKDALRPTRSEPETESRRWIPFAILAVPTAAALPHFLRASASPPRAWDAVTYHLPRAAQWVQDGGFVVHVAPDANRYYEFFAPAGDLLFAFGMLAGQGDAPLYLLFVGVWAANLLAAVALARSLGARPLDASLAAAVVMMLPCVVQLAGSAYVDGLTLFFTLAAATLAVRAGEAPRSSVPLALGALLAAGACATNKTSALPLFALVALYAAWLVRRGRLKPAVWLGGVAVALLPVALWMTHAAFYTGSPTYPIGVSVAGHELTSGNELFRVTHAAILAPIARQERTLPDFFRALFVGSFLPDAPYLNLNLGLGGAVAIVLGPIALFSMRGRAVAVRILLLGVALLPLVLVLLPSAAALRGFWAPLTGRLLTPIVAVPVCAAAAGRSSWFRYGLGLALVLSAPSLIPAGLTLDDLARGAGPIPIGVGLAAVIVALALLRLRPSIRWGLWVLVIALAPLGLMGLASARAAVRYEYYASSSYEFHPVPLQTHVPVWERLDGPDEERIALSVGWVPPGHNWPRYPLYGSRLQNRVRYVSATRSGAVYDTWDPATAGADMDADAYAARLSRVGITAIVLIAPPAPEASFVMHDPARFSLEYETPFHDARLYRPRWAGED